jgi:hypothetical protein
MVLFYQQRTGNGTTLMAVCVEFKNCANTELSVSVYHAFSPQKSMAKNKNVPGGLVRMFFQRFQSEFLRTEYPPA